MIIQVIQHAVFEGPARIAGWARERRHTLRTTLLFQKEPLPDLEKIDWLVIMGGPMGAYDEKGFPWLVREKRFIEASIGAGKLVLGICLGAQLVASVLGARVYKNRHKEIGWFPVQLTQDAGRSAFFRDIPREFTPFHWHGDTFDIPSGAVRTAESRACANQAFEYGGRVAGLQFHLEATREGVDALIEECGDELLEGEYVQGREQITAPVGFDGLAPVMSAFLDGMERSARLGTEQRKVRGIA
ncbi:MAG: type 1 glutamine amidotransferase [Candidatus Omnitrophica bacterium]|nr:type 1 glutamine amidotransferase [Candidatus Omnitrophota bacterium]